MKKKYLIFFIIFISVYSCFAHKKKFELIKTIGNDRENYILLGCNDAVLTENNDIYILNAKGNFISQFNWDGKFIRRIGRLGSGPGDLYFPISISYFDKKLYILENGNRRITIFNTISDEFSYYKENEKNKFGNDLYVINENKLLGIFQYIDDKRGRIGIVDKNFNLVNSFFNEYPVGFKSPSSKPTDSMSMETAARMVITSSYFKPVYFFDKNTNEILISFKYPDNPISFFVYNIEGELQKKFLYKIKEKKYKFTSYLLTLSIDKLRNPDNWPKRSELFIDSVFIYKNNYAAFLNLRDFKKKEMLNNQRYCLVFDKAGNLKDKFQLNKDLMIFGLSNGYFLGIIKDEEVEKLYIYKLNLQN